MNWHVSIQIPLQVFLFGSLGRVVPCRAAPRSAVQCSAVQCSVVVSSCDDTDSLMIEAIGVSTDDSYLSRNPLTPHMFTQLYGSKTF